MVLSARVGRTHASSRDSDRVALACREGGLEEVFQARTGQESRRRRSELELNTKEGHSRELTLDDGGDDEEADSVDEGDWRRLL